MAMSRVEQNQNLYKQIENESTNSDSLEQALNEDVAFRIANNYYDDEVTELIEKLDSDKQEDFYNKVAVAVLDDPEVNNALSDAMKYYVNKFAYDLTNDNRMEL